MRRAQPPHAQRPKASASEPLKGGVHALINEAGRLGPFGQHARGSTRRSGRAVPGDLKPNLLKAKERFTSGAVTGAVSGALSGALSGAGELAVARTNSPSSLTKSSSSLAEAEGAPATAPGHAWTVHDGEQLLLDLRSGLQREVIASLMAS